MWKPYLVLMGSTPVAFKCSAPKGGHVKANIAPVVEEFVELHCHSVAWKTAMAEVRSCTLAQEVSSGTSFLPPRSGEREGVEVIARVQKDCLEKVLRGSGEFGVLSRPFYVRGEPRAYKDVASGRVRPSGSSEESESDRANHPGSPCAKRKSDCEPKRATSRRWLVRFTQQRMPGGSWEIGGR